MIRFGIIRFGSVNDTEASVFGYSVFTRFVRPLPIRIHLTFFFMHYTCQIGCDIDIHILFQKRIILHSSWCDYFNTVNSSQFGEST